VTLLSDPPSTHSATDHRLRRGPSTGAAARRSGSSVLLRPVSAAIGRLDDADGASPIEVRRRIDRMLRDALDRHLASTDDAHDAGAAVPAVRVACAHLAAGDLEDAYLALLTARDLLR